MEALLHEHGLAALFLLSFLASTLIPLGSEWLLVLILMDGGDLVAVVGVATVGNTLGACTSYLVGMWGGTFLTQRILRVRDADLERAGDIYRKYGMYSLLLTWVPFVGDPLCVLSGIFRINILLFVLLVFLGKLARYLVVAWGAAAV